MVGYHRTSEIWEGREIQANQKNFKACKERIIVHETLNSCKLKTWV